MSDAAIDFFEDVVVPAIADFDHEEDELDVVIAKGSEQAISDARKLVMRRARTAAIELHQFCDRVHAESCILAPNGTLNEIRKWLRDSHGATDIELLHDVADAFKHAKLTRRPGNRDYLVQTDRAVVSLSTGYGRLGFGEGKFGGGEQVIICQADGTERALSSVLFNVRDAWRQAIALPLLGNVPK